MTRTLALGIDTSTQSCTVVLRRLDDGAPVAQARAPHPPTTPPRSEQDPRDWWTALLAALAPLRPQLGDVAAISVGGQGHGLVVLGDDDAPLRPAKLWNDTESAPDARALLDRLPAAEWVRRTGSAPAPALTVAKLAWTARCCPGLLAQARRVMLPADYLVFRLTGRSVTERGGASGTGYFDPVANAWEPKLAALAAPDIAWGDVLPDIIGSADPAGPARGHGLDGAVVGAGSGDNMTAALGLGVRAGDTVISLGTSGTVYRVVERQVCDPSGAINGYADATGRFMPMVTTLNAAKVTDMFRRLLGLGLEAFDEAALAGRAGEDGLVLVPYLDGERTPNLPHARGHLSGLRSDTDPSAVARAAVEGVLCGLLDGRDRLTEAGAEAGGPGGRLILTGGAGQSRAYRQILADLAGEPVWVSPMNEAAAAGAAVQAAAALGGRGIDAVAADWAPALAVVAEPRPNAAREAVRDAYRVAAAPVAAACA